MTDVKKVDVVSAGNVQTKKSTDPIEKEKAEKAKLNEEIQRELTTKQARKEAIEKAKQAYLQYGTVEGKKVENEKEAEKMAKNYVKDKRYEENSNGTQVFLDKEAYKAAEKERKEKREQLIEQYRNEGLSKKEAKQKADAQLVENEYLRKGIFGQKKTREYIEENKEMFYDENGNFSSDKFKETALKFANTHTKEGEAENHYLSLKERREVAEEEQVKASVIKNIVKKSNLGYERDNTNLYRGLYVVGMTGAGAGLGAIVGTSGILAGEAIATATSTATSSSDASAVIKDEAGNVLASSDAHDTATATDNATAKVKGGVCDAKSGARAGSLFGLSLGLSTMGLIKDKGNKEARIYTPGKEPQGPSAPEPTPLPVPPAAPAPGNITPPVQTPPQQAEPCPFTPGEEHEEFCDYKVKKGEYWTGIVAAKYKREDGTGFNLDPQKRTKEENKEIMEIVHYLKDKHGVKYSENIQPSTMRLYTEINGKKYNIDCDSAVKEKANKFPPAKRYTGKAADGTVRYFYTDCNGNRSQFFKTKEERDAAMQAAQQLQQAA